MNTPDNLKYHPEHTWARLDGGSAEVGITDFAQDELGDIVFVELPEEGQAVTLGEVFGTIESSPASARLVVVGSSEFLNDAVLSLSQSLSPERYLNNLSFLLNAVDWCVEDEELLTIRTRGTQARLLRDLTREQQSFWEGLNYAVALLGLIAIGIVWNVRQRGEEPIEELQAAVERSEVQ